MYIHTACERYESCVGILILLLEVKCRKKGRKSMNPTFNWQFSYHMSTEDGVGKRREEILLNSYNKSHTCEKGEKESSSTHILYEEDEEGEKF